MSLIIAVKSCQKDLLAGAHNTIRSTWGQDARYASAAGIVSVRFFIGEPASNTTTPRYEPDETIIKCNDSYKGLPYKTREICRWFIGKKIDHIFLCDTDTYVKIKYVLTSGYEKWDYFGYVACWHPREIVHDYFAAFPGVGEEVVANCYAWASGGVGYFLSQKAAKEIAELTPSNWAEDLWVGQALGPMIAKGDLTIQSTKCNEYTGNQYAQHYGNSARPNNYKAIAEWMQKLHAEWK